MKFSLLAKWFNAVAEAWNRGVAPWAYPDGTSEAIRVYNTLVERYPQEQADEEFAAWVRSMGVSLKRKP